MRNIKYAIYLVVITILLNCSHSRYILNHKDEICSSICVYPDDTIKVVSKDTVVKFISEYFIEPDLATIDMYLACDSLNNVLITKVDSLNGKRTIIKYILSENKLSLMALSDSISGLLEINRTLSNIEKTVYVDKIKLVEKPVYTTYWWQWVLHGVSIAIILYLAIKR